MPTGVGTIVVSGCSTNGNNGTYTLQNNSGIWSFTGQPPACIDPTFVEDSGSYTFIVRKSDNRPCVDAEWDSLPSGAPVADDGKCTGCSVSASGF